MDEILEQLMRDSITLARAAMEKEGLIDGRADGSLKYDRNVLATLASAIFAVKAAPAQLRLERRSLRALAGDLPSGWSEQ